LTIDLHRVAQVLSTSTAVQRAQVVLDRLRHHGGMAGWGVRHFL